MDCDLLKIHLQTTLTSKHSFQLQLAKTTLFASFPFSTQQQHHHQYHLSSSSSPKPKSKFLPLSVQCSSSISSPTPPTSKAEAILQAKTCLSTTLEKPLNNPKLTGKLKKLKQPRFRVEIPLIDDSPDSLSQLAFAVFSDIPINRKGSPVKISLVWPNHSLTESAADSFVSQLPNRLEHLYISSLTNNSDTTTSVLNSGDVAVFLAPEASQLAVMKRITDILYPKPVVIFNPGWGFEEEGSFGELSGFVASFEVVYSFMGLEVRGILNQRKGVIFKCVKDGVLSGERWTVFVEEGGEMKVISMFKARPSIGEVENVLYNLMAINSPITKSAKFLKDLVSNVTGKNF
ncbi:uncharacterized protein LOC132311098 isoform X2 [Cornus florida]|uniref:uncharacterized protein LOC132311098 isoform X2 n=1 Tax=Cornus florida TaxID=4283 RepID=UPI002897FB55|nr:uncharacterized protein LOC132311098 isoform X2 [Cornus florida]